MLAVPTFAAVKNPVTESMFADTFKLFHTPPKVEFVSVVVAVLQIFDGPEILPKPVMASTTITQLAVTEHPPALVLV